MLLYFGSFYKPYLLVEFVSNIARKLTTKTSINNMAHFRSTDGEFKKIEMYSKIIVKKLVTPIVWQSILE